MRGGRVPGWRWRVVGALVAVVWLSASGVRAGQATYARTVDGDGVVHVRQVPGGPRASWAEAGEGRRSAAEEGVEADAYPLDDERTRRYDRHIRGAAQLYQLPEALLRALIHTESRYRPNAVSPVGAIGLTQLMPATARYLGVMRPFDPRQNIYGGARFLRLLANRFNGDMVLVLAAYFAGAGAVQKHGGVPPFPGVRAYVKAVLRRYYAYERALQGVGQGSGAARAIAGP
ncbi:MAG TPA: lytic transglycosylase domain-containing protein [Nannocystaceae bacterium]|nr:lytic transglycosylase domain-containing protein [Nannocystaceae bacterium]